MIFFHQWLNKYTIHWQFMKIYELWNSIIFLNFKASLVIIPCPHPPTSLSRIAYENRYVTHPLTISFPTYSTESRLFLSLPMNHLRSYLWSKEEFEYLTKAFLPRSSKIITILFQVSVGRKFHDNLRMITFMKFSILNQ